MWEKRMRRLSELLSPQSLITASLKLSPEVKGKRRDLDCVRFEESVLAAMDKTGQWQW
jgi:hypothetical protein